MLVLGVSTAFLMAQEPETGAETESVFVDALWVAQRDGLVKLSIADGLLSLEILDLKDVRALAIDDRRSLVWVFRKSRLQAFAFDGELRFSVPEVHEDGDGEDEDGEGEEGEDEDDEDEEDGNDLELKEGKRADLVVNSNTGTVWLGLEDFVYQFDSSAQLLNILPLPEKMKSLAVDSIAALLWVATRRTLLAYDETGGRVHVIELDKEGGAKDIDVDPASGEIWLGEEDRLRRLDAEGMVLIDVEIKKLNGVVSDQEGGAWLTRDKMIMRIDSSGEPLFEVEPFKRKSEKLLALAVDPLDSSLWVAGKKKVAQVSGQGEILQELEPAGSEKKKPDIRDIALYVDVIPPEIALTAPGEGAFVNQSRPQLRLSFTDIGGGVDASTLSLEVNGQELVADCTFELAKGTATCLPITGLPEGVVELSATLRDLNGNLSEAAQVSFTVQFLVPGFPVLDPIGDQIVSVGSTLTLTVTATDAEGDPLIFFASPVPLPANASFNASTGLFTFTPSLTQRGVLTVTFIVSDGALTDSETITITTNGPAAGGVTELTGRLLDTNDSVLGVETPVVNATVSLIGTGFSTTSDTAGNFTLSGIPAGSQTLDIDTSTADPAPDGSPYASFREEITLIDGVTNVVERSFFLPRIATASLTIVDPNVTTVVTNPSLNVTLAAPPHTAKNPDGTDFTGQLSISEVPEGLAPASLPEELEPGLLITIQPVGVTFATPVPLTLPNIDNLPPGSETDLWSLDPDTGTFQIVGIGRVSADGTIIETISGGVRAADWHFLLSPSQKSTTNVPEKEGSFQDPKMPCNKKVSSTVALHNGCLAVDFSLPSHRSFGVSRSLRFIYKSNRAHPRPVLPFDATTSVRASVPPKTSYKLTVARIDQGVETFVNTSGLNENIDETIRAGVSFDGSGFPTGVYPYTIRLTSNYLVSRVSTHINDQVLLVNEQNSPLGAGWGIEGLGRLHLMDAGSVLWTSGEGGAVLFSGGPDTFHSPAGDFSTVMRNPDGTFTRSLKDGTTINFDVQGLQTSVVDRNGNTTSFSYDAQGRLISMTDPAALVTTLAYTGNLLSAITDPAARTTTFAHDSDGNLTHVTFPNASFKSFGYDSRHLMISETDERGFVVSRQYDRVGRLTQATLSDGSVRSLTSAQSVGLADLASGVGTEANPAAVVRPADAVNTFSDGNSNQQTIETGRFGAPTRVTDALGRTTLIERASGNNGTLQGGATFAPGQVGQAFSFDGVDDFVLVPDSSSLDLSTQFTLAAWINPSSLQSEPTQGGIISKGAPGGNGYQLGITNSNTAIFCQFNGPGEPWATNSLLAALSSAIAVGQWSHVACTYDNADLKIYEDGVLVGTLFIGSKSVVDSASNLRISSDDTNNVFFQGLIDEVEIFGRALSTEEIQSIFTTGSSGNHATPLPGLISGWQGEGDALDIAGATGQPTKITRANGAVSTMSYDVLDNLLTSTEQAINATMTFTYEPAFNQVSSVTDPEGNPPTTIDYDANGNPTKITVPSGTEIISTYADLNCPGQLTSVTAASGLPEENTATFQYDPLTCNLTQTTDPLLNTTILAYDAAGNFIQSTDGEGRVTRFQYDQLNRLIKVIDATNPAPDPPCATAGVTCYQYDAKGNLTQVTDTRGSLTLFEYDTQDRLIKTTDPLGNFETFTYDGNGNLLSTTDRNGQTIDFQYDAADQLIKKTLLPGAPGEAVTNFGYDLLGNLTSVMDPDSSLAMTYDNLSRLTSAATTGSPNQPTVSVSYTYGKNGNRLTMTDPTGQTQYLYDELNRLSSLSNPFLQTVTFDYDNLSRRTQMTMPNGVTTTYSYDTASQLLSLVHQLGATTISDFSYTYDKVGNRTSLDQQRSAVTVNPLLSYTYDQLNRLVDATHPLPTDPLETFDYDPVGNRLLRDGQTAPAFFDTANRLLEDEDFCYSYDANGNLASKEKKVAGVCNGTGELTDYQYDPENQLIQVQVNGAVVGSYRYDGLGRRIEKDTGGTLTQYVYDNEDILLEFDGNAVPGTIDVIHDLAADWSDVINPNSPWSYNSDPGTPITTHFDDWDAIDTDFTLPQPAWAATQIPQLGHVPVWLKAVSPTTSAPAGPEDLPIGTVGMHGSDPFVTFPLTDAGISWTSPDAGNVTISGEVWLARKTQGSSMDWRLKVNGTLISGGSLTSTDPFTSANPFDFASGSGGPTALTFPVAAGDVVDMELVKAPASGNGEYTAVNLTITETVGAVPPLARYTHGPGIDEPLVMERDLDASGIFEATERFFYHADSLGNITELTDSVGAVVQAYVYESFGQIVEDFGALENPYTYTGREFDLESNLYHYRARAYDPQTGRFLQQDPIGLNGGINPYVYVKNNPINTFDPLGLQGLLCIRKAKDELGALGYNHAYYWDTTAEPGQESLGDTGPFPFEPEIGPGPGNSCFVIEGSEGKEKDIRGALQGYIDETVFFPFVNDCFAGVEEAIMSQGLNVPDNPGRRGPLPGAGTLP